MTREEYIDKNLIDLLQRWANLAIISGSVVIIILSVLDYYVSPENFRIFLVYRIITASSLLISYYILNKNRSKKILFLSYFLDITIVSVMIALMISRYGGHESPYFAGMIIVLLLTVEIGPPVKNLGDFWTGLIYALPPILLYLIPILTYDTISNKAFFINANFFILTSAMSLIVIRHFIFKRFRNEFSLQYDLEEQKRQLSLYSEELREDVIRKRMELETSEQRFRELFENANDGVVVTDRNGVIINVNKRFCELTGFDKPSLIGTNIKILEARSEDGDPEKRIETILNGRALIFEVEHFMKDRELVQLEVSAKAININGETYIQYFYRDITEKKRLQKQLFQAQKMESIGILAGAIAHDFDNILTSIINNVQMIKNYSILDSRDKQRICIIEKSARRAEALISGLLSFSRKSTYKKRPVNLNEVIEDTLDLIHSMTSKKAIEIILNLSKPFTVSGDSNLLSQVIMNLLVNSIDAMPAGGKIIVSTTPYRNEGAAVPNPVLISGDYVLLSITDTGTGIPDEIRDRIFEPFFTTKGEGKRTGLGLSIVYRIVKEHDGVVTVESRPGRGTTFNIYLPVIEGPEEIMPPVKSGKRQERILVVDDNIDLLNFVKDLLESQGYNVLAISDPLLVYEIDKYDIETTDLLITDIIMPNKNGKELIRYLKGIKPSLKTITISAHDIWNIGKRDRDINAYISKPFEGVYLLTVVRRVLDSEAIEHIK